MILLRFKLLGLLVRKQAPNSRKVDIPGKESQSSVHFQYELLTFKNEPVSFFFVYVGAPMVI
jgi:hypothetical protein